MQKHIDSADVATRKVLFEKTFKLKEKHFLEAGCVWAPYIPMYLTETIDLQSYTGISTTTLSKYAEKPVNQDCYSTIKFG